ncbi:MAG: sel1 repeat family protein, partial [Myxococcales bacterium]|nr:sel1 repeat family protein [Myxococcales bacterium]
QILITGTGVEPDYPRAFTLLDRACKEQQDELACAWLGLAYHRGRGVEADAEQAVAYYQRGCDQGYSFGCVGMAKLHEQGFGVRKSGRAAKKYYARACDLGSTQYCTP